MDATKAALLKSFSSAASAIVADALDRLGLRHQSLDPAIRPLWPQARVVGWAVPVQIVADDSVPAKPYDGEMSALDALKTGDVPVFSVPAGLYVASWGELFSCGAIGRGARGVVVDGMIRDARQIQDLGFATFARGCSPLDTFARAVVRDYGTPTVVGGVRVNPGDLVVGDIDGVVIVPSAAAAEVANLVHAKRKLEQSARDDLLAGMGIRDVWTKYGVF